MYRFHWFVYDIYEMILYFLVVDYYCYAAPRQGPLAPLWNNCPTKAGNNEVYEVDIAENAITYRIL